MSRFCWLILTLLSISVQDFLSFPSYRSSNKPCYTRQTNCTTVSPTPPAEQIKNLQPVGRCNFSPVYEQFLSFQIFPPRWESELSHNHLNNTFLVIRISPQASECYCKETVWHAVITQSSDYECIGSGGEAEEQKRRNFSKLPIKDAEAEKAEVTLTCQSFISLPMGQTRAWHFTFPASLSFR